MSRHDHRWFIKPYECVEGSARRSRVTKEETFTKYKKEDVSNLKILMKGINRFEESFWLPRRVTMAH